MQIDGHHTLTYVVARIAGMPHGDAEKLAYCAQYVDEAVNSDPIKFKNGAMFSRISSAHKMIDYRNMNEMANHLAWIPFHFLPGNDGLPAGENPDGSFIKKLVCKPNSYVAHDMLKVVAKYRNEKFGLHIMGIAMHVYADTFAHQGFAGVSHEINEIEDIQSESSSLLQRVRDGITTWSISSVSPLGHGPALSFPDRPYARWSYINGLGVRIERDNAEIFMDAANNMYKVIKCYLAGDDEVQLEVQDHMPSEDLNKIRAALETITDDDGDVRHSKWLKLIAEGHFSFEPVEITFITNGKKSWKYKSRGKGLPIPMLNDVIEYKYNESFLDSDWKLFHDALKTFRLQVIRDVLPKYGICIA
ncbi:DUF6765 family protein [Photobacterium indicum]|uniref:DUF6765 family protein n=1 Tax=Photobacterium indicum TaxID=81447 RepID=UPI003D0E66FD